jgi:hypothetical protein
MNRNEMLNYEAPLVEVIEVEVENGFAVSGVPAFTPFGGDGEQDWG